MPTSYSKLYNWTFAKAKHPKEAGEKIVLSRSLEEIAACFAGFSWNQERKSTDYNTKKEQANTKNLQH